MYLPAVFVNGGIHNLPDSNFTGHIVTAKKEYATKFTCGIAYCHLPFFLAAHAYAHMVGLPATGFSTPYFYAIMLSCMCWAIFGLYVLKKLLLQYYSRTATWLSILCIALGTNFYYYATEDVAMSHIYSFALFAVTIYLTDSYYKRATTGKAILLAILLSWIMLIRPTNAAILVFLLLYRVVSVSDLKTRFIFFKANYKQLLAGIPFFIAMLLPQLYYWKEMTGHLVSYSYDKEAFIYLAAPKIGAVLVDTQNGWLLYSPIMLFIFWSLITRRKDPRTSALATITTLVVITYIFASWWAWWFGGAFGHRCYIEYYPLLAFALAMTMEQILAIKSKWAKGLLFLLILIFCYYSVGMASIFLYHGIWDGPYWRWNYDKWWDLVRMAFFLPV